MSYILPFIEVHAVDHCNHTCRWCHNYSPIAPEREYDASEYFSGLDALKENGVLINIISIMGGEPFLHKNLTTFAYDLALRYRRPLIITTNGFWLSSENIRLYKDFWPLLHIFKLSRYPSIEKRLGGEQKIRKLLDEIKSYNPEIQIDWPDKYYFNELAFFDSPIEPELYCGNTNCLALMTDMRIGHCGAGAYQKFALEGSLSKGFIDSKDMFYDLRQFDLTSFDLWRKRYPLDACYYCNFGQKQRRVPWKPLKGKGIFRKEYEYAFERDRCLELDMDGQYARSNERILNLLAKEPAAMGSMCTLLLQRHADGNTMAALDLIQNILRTIPSTEESKKKIQEVASQISSTVQVPRNPVA